MHLPDVNVVSICFTGRGNGSSNATGNDAEGLLLSRPRPASEDEVSLAYRVMDQNEIPDVDL